MRLMLVSFAASSAAMLSSHAVAADIVVSVEIPRLSVAEYHRPYVAIWLEADGGNDVTNLAVWYDLKMRDNEGAKWLKDMRQWWRRSGRNLQMPADGLSSATRPPGSHQIGFAGGKAPLDKLKPGKYELIVEAAREVGGREILRIPFLWPPQAAQSLNAKGEHELSAIGLELKP